MNIPKRPSNPQKRTLARLLDHLVREWQEGAVLSHAPALGRLDTVSCQRVKWASSGAILISARRPPISIATNAVMSAIVKESPATNLCPFTRDPSVQGADRLAFAAP